MLYQLLDQVLVMHYIRLVQIDNEWCYISRIAIVVSDVLCISCLSFGPVYSAYVTIGLLLVLVLGHISV
jgi:hypothetical protein